ncbi:hypothetical protein EVJ50_13535 [Synechococcus sp. RSCCF101]|uniref:hypothetical protein n=1 Tax=Synechococcus sp. RSCCF101 TaxID=2511069 RepID=UPI001246034F|nr:hypothetical protein [Synechococcus sp. RSCCF101]QEY33102.1 hypothetical protein EVJ50_13535 [Synechococcus sp. RSCCF101]
MQSRRRSSLSKRHVEPFDKRPLRLRLHPLRETFLDGSWTNLKLSLESAGWSPQQVEFVHQRLQQGWSVDQATRYVARTVRSCPWPQGLAHLGLPAGRIMLRSAWYRP